MGLLLDTFGIHFFDDNLRSILSRGIPRAEITITGDRASWTPDDQLWNRIVELSGTTQNLRWVIEGSASAPGLITGPYLSDASSFLIQR